MKEIIFKELSYQITSICFKIHNELGRFCREKQYTDKLELMLKDSNIRYNREISLNKLREGSPLGNRADFVINSQMVVDLKAKPLVSKDDYYQM